jgi:diguanylate cyclase (GGDEF)-like protein
MTLNSTFLFLYDAILWVGLLLCGWLSWFAWTNRRVPGSMPLLVLHIAIGWWLLAYSMPLPDAVVAANGGSVYLRFRLMFLGMVATSPAFLAFTLEYTGHGPRTRSWLYALLALEPLLLLMLIWNPGTAHLVFGEWRGQPDDGRFAGTAYFWLHALYNYALTLFALGLLVRHYRREAAVYRSQLGLMFAGALVPTAVSMLSLSGAAPYSLDLTPVGFAVGSALLAYAAFRYRLLELVPIARRLVVENMADGIVMLDKSGRILDFNPAAQHIVHDRTLEAGLPIGHVLPGWSGRHVMHLEEIHGLDEVIRLESGCYVDVRVRALKDGKRRVSGLLLILRDITEARKISRALEDANRQLRGQLAQIESMQTQLREQAVRDSLTGLYNRHYMEEALAQGLAKSCRCDRVLAVVLIDIDNFKRLNDTYGHLAGDEILKGLAQVLIARSRYEDVACRYGGEEFMVILRDTTTAVAQERAEQWRKAFAGIRFRLGDSVVSATFSAGVAGFPEHAQDRAGLIGAADMALYAAKASGRNRVVVATSMTSSFPADDPEMAPLALSA